MSVSPTTLQVPEVRILSILFISGITVPGMLFEPYVFVIIIIFYLKEIDHVCKDVDLK